MSYTAAVNVMAATFVIFEFKNIELGLSATVIKPPSLDPEFISATIASKTCLCFPDAIVRSIFSCSSSTSDPVILV